MICSWDIGIKNLAYCIINNEGQIVQWDVIDFSQKFIKEKCSQCRNSAKYCVDDSTYFCETHKKIYLKTNRFEESLFISKQEEKDTCCECGKGAYYKSKENRMYCSTHKKSYLNKTKKQFTPQTYKPQKPKQNLFELCQNMFIELDKINILREVEHIVIEHQATNTKFGGVNNHTMKVISSYLVGYFTRLKIDLGVIREIVHCNANNKLKINQEFTERILGNIEDEDKRYKMTKNLGVEYTYELLQDSDWLIHLRRYKKQDDLCDAYLQGLYYLNRIN